LDLNVIPLSMAGHKASGPATLLFRMTPPTQGSSRPPVWSPDSTRVALTGKADPADEEDIRSFSRMAERRSVLPDGSDRARP
jgi:hypothetical protein